MHGNAASVVVQFSNKFTSVDGCKGKNDEGWYSRVNILGFTTGSLKGITIDIETLTNEYCAAMGWEPKTLKPSQERLEAVGLTEITHEG